MSSPRVTTSFILPHDKLEALRKRLPRKGERSIVLEKLIDLFLSNKVRIESGNKIY